MFNCRKEQQEAIVEFSVLCKSRQTGAASRTDSCLTSTASHCWFSVGSMARAFENVQQMVASPARLRKSVSSCVVATVQAKLV